MWRGIEWVEMIWHWSQSDPELKYEWIIANYWTVEDWLYEQFVEDLQEQDMYELYKNFCEADSNRLFNWRLHKNIHLVWEIFWYIKQNNIL